MGTHEPIGIPRYHPPLADSWRHSPQARLHSPGGNLVLCEEESVLPVQKPGIHQTLKEGLLCRDHSARPLMYGWET